MNALDDWAARQWSGMREGLSQGFGDITRGAWADIGNAYQQILTQHAEIGPPTPMTGDMVIVHDPLETPASDLELHALIGAVELKARIDAHEIAQTAATTELEQDVDAPSPDVSMDWER